MKPKATPANSKSRISLSTSLDGNPKTVLEKLREQSRLEKEAKPEDRAKEMFNLDRGLLDSLVLPSKVSKIRTITSQRAGKKNARDDEGLHEAASLLPTHAATGRRRDSAEGKTESDIVVHPYSEQEDGPVDGHLKNSNTKSSEFSFLPNAIGISTLHQNLGQESKNVRQTQRLSQEASGDEFTDDVSAILSTLHTADDAVNYFARYGSETPIKFIHLVSKESREFSPYDLMVTTQNEMSTEHYVMSSSGIVRISPMEQSEVVPLSVWMKQKINFRILRMIPFFKYYLHRKVFNIWFENVRYQLFLKQRKKVTERLFLARKTTCPAIIASKRHLRESRNVHLLSAIGADFKPSDKDVIMEKQLGQLAKASIQFEEYVRRIIDEVTRVINDINNIHSSAYQDQSSNVLSFADTITPEKLKSLVRLKQEKAERKLMRYRARIEFQTLPDFIRYMDYVVLENFFESTLNGIEKFYDEFVRPRKSGIFDTMIRFTNATADSGVTDTVFNPTCLEIQEMIQKLFESVIETVSNLNRVGYLTVKPNALGSAITGLNNTTNSNLNEISATTSNALPLTSSIQTILHENKQFRLVLSNIHSRILTDFERAEEHAMSYDVIKPIYKFNSDWSIESYRSHGYDITQLKLDLDRITNWVKDLEKLRNRPIGILDVDSRKLKMELNPILEMRLIEIKEYIKEMARFRCQQLLNHYKDCINKFMARPLVLKDFANQIQFVLTSKEDEKNLFIQTSQVDQMYNLLQAYDVSIPSDDSVLHEQLHDRQNEYKKEIVVVCQFHDQHRMNMVAAVNDSIAKLNRNIEKFLEKLDDPDFTMTLHYEDSDTILDDLDLHTSEFKSLNDLAKTYSSYQRLLNEPIAEYKELDNGAEKLQTTKKLWETISAWNLSYEEWNDSQFADLDVENVEKVVGEYYKETLHLNKVINCKATDKLAGQINDFRKILPSILDLGNKNMKARHFEKLFRLINQVYYSGMPFTLFQIRKGGLMNHKEVIAETSAIATGEAQLEEQLTKIKETWEKMRVTTMVYREQQNVHILGSLSEIMTKLNDHQLMIQGMLKSRYIQGLFDRVDSWNQKLNTLTDIFDEWLQFQKGWIQLESIFTNEDIPRQLPLEAQKFLAIDRSWKLIMTRTVNEPMVLSCLLPMEGAANPSIYSTLKTNNEILETIQKSLEDYIDTKRQIFPRLYVLSSREVMELLSRTSKDTHNIRDYISKCFEGVSGFHFQDDKLIIDSIKGKNKGYDEVIGWYGNHDEYIKLSAGSIRLEGSCESWLLQFEQVMRTTLMTSFKDAAIEYSDVACSKDGAKFLSFVQSHSAQSILIADHIAFTSDVTGVLFTIQVKMTVSTMKETQGEVCGRIELLAGLIHQPISNVVRSKLYLLLLQFIHQRDILESIHSATSSTSYDWLKQLRYYFDVGRECVNIKQCRSTFSHGYEYNSDMSRLVITPLMDSCFLTLASALAMNQGGALLGKSAVGKSETIRELSKALGVQCIFLNCSDSLTYKTLGRLLGGLAQQGSWICFDEFHRVAVEVLSVIAQQLMSIQTAIKRRALHFDFGGKILPLNSRFGAFITMNTSALYSGSRDIPENVKSLFRPMTMSSPSLQVIAEAILTASGYLNACTLARKVEYFVDLCKKQLSKQTHYDFSVRMVKRVLEACMLLKIKEPDTQEDVLLVRTLKEANLSKLVEHDVPVCISLINDVFPGVKSQLADNHKLTINIEKSLQAMHLQKSSAFLTKAQQIHDAQSSQQSVVIVGESGCGKSTLIRVLGAAYGSMMDASHAYDNVDISVVYPAAMSISELYGGYKSSAEWRDGIIPTMLRDNLNTEANKVARKKWIVFDGSMESEWVDYLNSVVDVSRNLCLPSSERVQVPDCVSFMFEADDLSRASPALLSRCGVVYIEESQVDMLALVRHWGMNILSKYVNRQTAKAMVATIEANIEVTVSFVHSECKELTTTTSNHLVQSFLHVFLAKLIEYLGVDPSNQSKSTSAAADMFVQDIDLMNATVLWCLIWSVAANIDDNSRIKFHEWCRSRFSTTISSKYIMLLQDPFGTCLDLATKEIKTWTSMISAMPSNITSSSDIFVPTIDTTRYSYVLRKLCGNQNHVMLIGESCVGKTMIVKNYLSEMLSRKAAVTFSTYRSFATKDNLRNALETKLERKRKVLLAPPAGKTFYLFIDDINLKDERMDDSTNEFVRELLDSNGFYDRDKQFFKSIEDVVCLSAMNPSRAMLNPRLLRRYFTMAMPKMTTDNTTRIFHSLTESYTVKNLSADRLGCMQAIVRESSVRVQELLNSYSESSAMCKYRLNIRNILEAYSGLIQLSRPTSQQDTLKSWLHEMKRAICDRIVDMSDRQSVSSALLAALRSSIERFGDDEAKAITIDDQSFSESTFGSLAKIPTTMADFQYFETEPMSVTAKDLEKYIEDLKQQGVLDRNIVMFPDVVLHVLRLIRVIARRKGHALLFCKDGGVGRRSVLRLTSYLFTCSLLSFQSTAADDYDGFRKGLGESCVKIMLSNQPSLLVLEDAHIVDQRILNDVYNLTIGENLAEYLPQHLHEDTETIASLRSLAKGANRDVDTADSMKIFMEESLLDRLHVVICCTYDSFNQLNRQAGKVFERFSMDWYDPWPKEALQSIAHQRISSAAKLSASISAPTSSTSLSNVDLKVDPFVDQLAVIFCQIFQSVDKVASTSLSDPQQRAQGRLTSLRQSSYLEYINVYVSLLQSQRNKLTGKELRYRLGLKKMQETDAFVKVLEQNLARLQPGLVDANKKTAQLLEQINQDKQSADNQAKLIDAEVLRMNEEAVEVESIKNGCQSELNLVLPQYEAALKALETLDKKSLQELKMFNNPPDLVKVTMEAVCVLFDKSPTWEEAKKLLSLMDFMDRLVLFDKDNVSPKIIVKLEKYYSDGRFVPEEVKKQSTAAMCLCMWVRAMAEYFQVARAIEPKREALRKAELKYNETKANLEKKTQSLGLIQRKIEETNDTLRLTEAKKSEIEMQLESITIQLKRAEEIVKGLENERRRWETAADSLSKLSSNVIGDTIIVAGIIALISSSTKSSRAAMIEEWRKICLDQKISISDNISLADSILDNPVALQSWSQYGLPSDAECIENAVIITHVSTMNHRWPFIMDPHGFVNRWLRGVYSQDNIQVLNALETNEGIMKVLDYSIQNGLPLLIENIFEKLNPLIEHLLLKVLVTTAANPQPSRRGSTQTAAPSVVKIRIGDIEIPYNNSFKLFLLTTDSRIPLAEDVLSRLTVINFNITTKSYEELLLDNLIRFEKPDLSEKQSKVQVSLSQDRKTLEEIEAQILTLVSSSNSSILENEELVSALSISSLTSSTLIARIEEAEVMNEEISIVREGYRNIATRAAVLYQVLSSASSINAMYNFSLSHFKEAFYKTLQQTEKKDNSRTRAATVIPALTRNIFEIGSRGMMNKDKILFALLIASSIQIASGALITVEWDVFVRGINLPPSITNSAPKQNDISSILSPKSQLSPTANLVVSSPTGRSVALSKRPFPAILAQIGQSNPKFPINEILWSKCVVLEATLPAFAGLCGDIMGKSSAWALYLESESLSAQRLPGAWETKLNEFQKLTLLRVLREDHILFGIKRYVLSVLGESFLEPASPDLRAIVPESANKTPIIFYLAQGMDPTGALIQLARDQGIYDPEAALSDSPSTSATGLGFGDLKIVSLGQGQEPIAEKAIEICQRAGYWLCIENCHLVPEWMPRLEQIIDRTMTSSEPPLGSSIASPKFSDNLHSNFRLWLTTTHTSTFPKNIIRRSTLLTSEAPRGIRALMLQIFASFSDEDYASCCGCSNQKMWRKIFFGLAFTHAQILERRNYGTVGWRDDYQWILNDFMIAMDIVKDFIDDHGEQQRKLTQQQLVAKTTISANPDDDDSGNPSVVETPMISPRGLVLPPQLVHVAFSWDSLAQAVADGAYSGRIKDNNDKTTLVALLQRVLEPSLLEKPRFRLCDGDAYVVPSNDATRQAIIDHVKAFPSDDHPAVLQLPASSAQITMLTESMDLMLKLSRNHAIVEEIADYSLSKQLQAKIEDITSRIARSLDTVVTHAKEGHGNLFTPLHMVLSQEISDYNNLTEAIHRSCAELVEAAKEKIAFSDELEYTRKSLQSNKVPLQWQRLSYHGTDDLDPWICDLAHRLSFIHAWITGGPPKVYSLACIFDPARFLLALKLSFARETKLSIESLEMTCEMTPLSIQDVRMSPLDGVYLYGLRLVNGKFNRHSKALDDGSAGALEAMPCIVVRFRERMSSSMEKSYLCPLYQHIRASPAVETEDRLSNYIDSLLIPCSNDGQHWRRRGCVLVTSNEE